MLTVRLSDEKILHEIDRILSFIQKETDPNHSVIIGVSGGIDSDTAVRLCYKAIGKLRIKCFTALQEDMEGSHLNNARALCEELEIPLVEIDFRNTIKQVLPMLEEVDSEFAVDGLLDIIRMKVSLRTVIFSMYNEHGYVIVCPSNRTELETGLYMSLGDALGHIKPLAHLYKTQVRQVAEKMGAQSKVLEQTPSSGLHNKANDLEDIAYWLQHGGPFIGNIDLDSEFKKKARMIFESLTFEKLDTVIFGLNLGMDHSTISDDSGLPIDLVDRIHKLTENAKKFKGRPLGLSLK